MKTMHYLQSLQHFAQVIHRFRTPLLFWIYMLALMAYAYGWMP